MSELNIFLKLELNFNFFKPMFYFLNHGRRNTGGSETLAAWSCPYQRYATDLLLVGQLLQLAMLSYSQSKCPA